MDQDSQSDDVGKRKRRDAVVLVIAKGLFLLPLPVLIVHGTLLGKQPPFLEIVVAGIAMVVGLALATEQADALDKKAPLSLEPDAFELEWDAQFGEAAEKSQKTPKAQPPPQGRQPLDLEGRRRKRSFTLKNPDFFKRN